MTTHIALLRAVNVGGHAKLPMADLRAFFARLGLTDAQTLLQTGNVVFGGATRTSAGLERLLESEAAKHLGVETAFVVRSAREWKTLVAANPFREMAARDPSHLLVMFLKNKADPRKLKALQAAISGREVVRVKGRQAYITYPDGIGTSRLTHAILERALGSRGTSRNWNTVLKLAALAEAL
jgi:uncharacterized protein (DUF1697 family)